tara:strand:- start:1861 stop:2559 length:699 start_codon:yes stop_codon:yes gene_type:complete
MKREAGNALFLILIAVALFAALSYAVTNSERGGGGIDKEKATILASQMTQDISRVQSAIQRLKIIGGYDQIFLNDSLENAAGNCFRGSTVTTPCNTVGMFSVDGGQSELFWTDEIRDPSYADTTRWHLTSIAISISGTDVGTDAPDIIMQADGLAPEVCKAMDKKFADGTIGTLAIVVGDGHSWADLGTISDSGYTAASAGAADIKYDISKEGCILYSGTGANHFVYVIEEY